jgi:hypothetical protein
MSPSRTVQTCAAAQVSRRLAPRRRALIETSASTCSELIGIRPSMVMCIDS